MTESALLDSCNSEATPQPSESDTDSLTERQFAQFQKLIHSVTGISMSDAKKYLVFRRVINRVKAAGSPDVDSYLARLQAGDPAELEQFCNAVTTNLTSFFREAHHFAFLREKCLPAYRSKGKKQSQALKIWSAGCSTGEEPYSIAMTVRESMPEATEQTVKILATDLDTDVLATASNGVYAQNRLRGLSEERMRRFFLRRKTSTGFEIKARDDLKDLITFRPLNLMNDWPMSGKFDIIFCRNVMIYFDRPTQKRLIDRFAQYLKDDGYLIVGHSESMNHFDSPFEVVGQTIHAKANR